MKTLLTILLFFLLLPVSNLLILYNMGFQESEFIGYNINKPNVHNKRKVIGYDNSNNKFDDGNGYWGRDSITFWDNYENYEYYWDPKTKTWYRYNSSGWDLWISISGLWYHWSLLNYGGPKNPTTQYYKDPLTPIGSPLYLLPFGLLYLLKKKKILTFNKKIPSLFG